MDIDKLNMGILLTDAELRLARLETYARITRGYLTIALIALVVLRVSGNIEWPWWAILAPILVPAGLSTVWFFVFLTLKAIFDAKEKQASGAFDGE